MLCVAGGMVGRNRERAAVQSLLECVRNGPAGLILEGEAGIGKTTVLQAAVGAAASAGFTVMSAGGATAEVGMAFAAIADLLGGVGTGALDTLPPVQRASLNRVLLRGSEGPTNDERAAAAAFLSVLHTLADSRPVLVAIDDAQWIDASSRAVLGFALRRVKRRIAVIATVRNGGQTGESNTDWIALPAKANVSRIALQPMSVGGLHKVIMSELGAALSRPLITRIHALSGGNPFYGVELARSRDVMMSTFPALPARLDNLIGARLDAIDPHASRLLLICACQASPQMSDLALVHGGEVEEVVALLHGAEKERLVVFDGDRIRFTHPLLAHAVYARASAADRRAVHSALAGIDDHIETRARHLALAAVTAEESTLNALDEAAESAASRGAHSSAAELVELAINLGGRSPVRRLRAADYHFRAGALEAAERIVGPLVDELPMGTLRTIALMVQGGVRGYRHGLASAADVLARAVEEAGDNTVLRAQGLMLLSLAIGLTGDMTTCVAHARRAYRDAMALGVPTLRSQTAALWVHVSFMYGLGTDQAALATALADEDPDTDAPATVQASAVFAINCAWTGQLHDARSSMAEIARRCGERGNEVDVVWAASLQTVIDIWLGRYADAARTASDAFEHAQQIGGQLPLIDAQTSLAAVAAYTGRLADAYEAATAAAEAARSSGMTYLAGPPLMSLAFAQVSSGRYGETLQTLEPLLASFDSDHDTEIVRGAYLPDAIEALIHTGQTDRATPLVEALQSNGARLGRAWMLAVGARGRAQLLAHSGDLQVAEHSALQALAHHDQLPMPFENARTQLLLGQIQRRRRRPKEAIATLTAAAAAFDELGSPLWADRAHAELRRLASRSNRSNTFTPAERQVAEKAAAGFSNREIATALSVSPKTVEMHLSNVYRKAGVHSRAQLAARWPSARDDAGPSPNAY